jgi:hypothetical protein
MPPESQTLIDELEADADVAFSGGRTNNISDLLCSIGAIVASFIAAVLAAVSGPGWLTATVAVLPGVFASLQRVIDFRGRAAWYFIKSSQLRGLSRNVKYEIVTAKEGAKQFGDLDRAMEERWSEFVRSGSPPPQSPTNK